MSALKVLEDCRKIVKSAPPGFAIEIAPGVAEAISQGIELDPALAEAISQASQASQALDIGSMKSLGDIGAEQTTEAVNNASGKADKYATVLMIVAIMTFVVAGIQLAIMGGLG